MPPARTLPLATVVVFALSACSGASASDGGEDELSSLPDEDVELRCSVTEDLPIVNVGSVVGSVRLGPCGHAAYRDDQGQGWLLAPDGTRSEFEHSKISFAPTGDLIVWEPESNGGLRLRELLGGAERELIVSGSIDSFGLVPSFADPSRSAWAWSCDQGVLERHDLAVSERIAETVVCGSVVGSSGSPRLVYADHDGRVWLADLDAGALVATDDLEFAGHDGSKRDDSLWIDHDGELLTHVAIEWQGDDDVDSEWPIELWGRALISSGETVLESASGLGWKQAARRGAPVLVFDDGALVRFDAGAPSSVGSGLQRSELAESGELIFATEADELFMAERAAEDGITSIGQFNVPVEIRASRSATSVAIEHHTDTCIVDDLGDCSRIVLALRKWTRASGLEDLALHSTSPWELLAAFDDGRLLVIGSPVEIDGDTYAGEQPEPRVLLLSAKGEIEAELPAPHGGLAVRQVFVVADDRVLFEYQSQAGVGSLIEAGSELGFVSLVNDIDIALLQAWVDARGRRIAVVAEEPGGTSLLFGSPL